MLELEVGGGRGRIFIGENFTPFIVRELREALPAIRAFAIITDKTIESLYLKDFINAFDAQGIRLQSSGGQGRLPDQRLLTYIVLPGERSKSREIKGHVEDFLLAQGCNRDTCLIALGGGVVGDLVGFIASTFLRGVPLVQIPTTLLAMVDSSIGGKNGVDTPAGKNLIGTIYEPRRGFTDLSFLHSLGKREFYNGMAEIVKTAAISSEEDFRQLEDLAEPLSAFLDKLDNLSVANRNAAWMREEKLRAQLREIVFASTKFKVGVVAEDARDDGLRQLLNFGHTIGHALEHHYAPKLLHGECVALGMILELRVAQALGHCKSETVERVERLLKFLNLPVSINDQFVQTRGVQLPTQEQVMQVMRLDKKNSGGRIQMVLLKEIGQPVEPRALPVAEPVILKVLQLKKTSEDSDHILKTPLVPQPTASILLIGTSVVKAQQLAVELKYQLRPFTELTEKSEASVLFYGEADNGQNADFLSAVTKFVSKAGIVLQVKDQAEFSGLNNIFTFVDHEGSLRGLVHLANFARGLLDNPLPDPDFRSFFLCLAVSDIVPLAPQLERMAHGVHAVEYRVDLLSAAPPNFQFETKSALVQFKSVVAQQIGLLREKLRDLPIIYTLRTVAEGGRMPDNASSDIFLELYLWGLQCGCEIVDLQVNMNMDTILTPFLKAAKGRCKIIASYHHLPEPLNWGGETCSRILGKCQTIGDVVKLVSVAHRPSDNRALEEFTESYYELESKIPLIALNMSPQGQITRMKNRYLTPVTHPEIFQAPRLGLSQLSLKETLLGQTLTGMLPRRRFHLFGHPISHSRSPIIHNTIFKNFGLPHEYTLLESEDLDAVKKAIREPDFGGGSVTMPFKLSIIPFLDSLSESARRIGAVNTVIRRKENSLYGDNTDWLGVLGCLRRVSRGVAVGTAMDSSSALVLGAGGTARSVVYALHQFGITSIYVYNRSPDRLQEFISSFPEIKLIGLNSVTELQTSFKVKPFVLVDCLPPNAGICTVEFVRNVLPPSGGVFIKLAYYGPSDSGPEASYGLKTRVIGGLDVLVEQGLWQSEMWTGLRLVRSESFRKSIHDVVHGR